VNTILWAENTAPDGPSFWLGGESVLTIHYSDVEGGQTSTSVQPDCNLSWGDGMIETDPLFTNGPAGVYYLSQVASGQGTDSPCMNGGDPESCMIIGTTRTDLNRDDEPVDMGYHYPGSGTHVVPYTYVTIQSAIDEAEEGDIIIVKPGVYPENIDFHGKPVTVMSEWGPEMTTINGISVTGWYRLSAAKIEILF